MLKGANEEKEKDKKKYCIGYQKTLRDEKENEKRTRIDVIST